MYGFEIMSTRPELETNRVRLTYPLLCHALPCLVMIGCTCAETVKVARLSAADVTQTKKTRGLAERHIAVLLRRRVYGK